MRAWNTKDDKYHGELQENVQKAGTVYWADDLQKATTPVTYVKTWRIGQNRKVSFILLEIV